MLAANFVEAEIKVCKTCLEEKSLDEFYLADGKNGQFYPRGACRACHLKELREKKLATRYGLSLSDLIEMIESHSNKCAICNSAFKGREPYIDHCHTTGKPRGLLCSSCNFGLGNFKDNVEFLANAIVYLEKSKHAST